MTTKVPQGRIEVLKDNAGHFVRVTHSGVIFESDRYAEEAEARAKAHEIEHGLVSTGAIIRSRSEGT